MSVEIIFSKDGKPNFVFKTKDSNGKTLPEYMKGEDLFKEIKMLLTVRNDFVLNESSEARLVLLSKYVATATGSQEMTEREAIFKCNAHAIKLCDIQSLIAQQPARQSDSYLYCAEIAEMGR